MTDKQKILIVDDEARNRKIIMEILGDIFDSKLASTGEEALEIAPSYTPDLILLDIMMPGINGFEVCKKIKADKNFVLTKIILVSGKAMISERLQGYEVGADDYLTKPFEPEELLAKVKVFLRLSQTERQLNELNQTLDQQVQEKTRQLIESEAKLIHAARIATLGEMAGGVAHEINSPLATISLSAEQLFDFSNDAIKDEKLKTDPKMVAKLSKRILDMVNRISTIVRGLKTFARDDSLDMLSRVRLQQIIDDTLVLCKEKIRDNNIEFTVENVSDKLEILCQPVPISQVLLNLISNSCDAIHSLENKWIRLETKENNDFIQISVSDSGNGIPEKIRDKLFLPFFTTKEIGKGTGLGLSISKGIIGNHGGTLELDTESKNTKFIIRLPKVVNDRLDLEKDYEKAA